MIRKLLETVLFVFLSSCSSLNSVHHSDLKTCKRLPAKSYVEPPEPIVLIPGNHFYSDSQNSVIDESLYKQNEKARKPLRNYLVQIIKMSEHASLGDQDASFAVNKWLQ